MRTQTLLETTIKQSAEIMRRMAQRDEAAPPQIVEKLAGLLEDIIKDFSRRDAEVEALRSDLEKAYERLRKDVQSAEVPGPQGPRCQSRSGMGQCELASGHVEDHLASGLRWMSWAGDSSIHSRPTSADHYTCMRCQCSWDRPGPKMCPICEKEDQVVYPYI